MKAEIEQANFVLATFMGFTRKMGKFVKPINSDALVHPPSLEADLEYEIIPLDHYSSSLDNQLVVWKEIGYLSINLIMSPYQEIAHNTTSVQLPFNRKQWHTHEDGTTMAGVMEQFVTAQESSCISTAKMIEEMKWERNLKKS